LTSQYGAENRFLKNGDVLDTSLNTLPKILQKADYETAFLGKWHVKSQPLGFDYCQAVKGQGSYIDPVFLKSEEWNDKREKRKSRGFFTDLVTDRAIQWLETRNSDKPFALFVHHKAPHSPHITPERYDSLFTEDFTFPSTFNDNYEGKTFFLKDYECPYSKLLNAFEFDIYNSVKNKTAPEHIKRGTSEYKEWAYQTLLKGYYRQIANLDDNIGELLDYIEQKDLNKKTIIIYAADNGWFLGHHGLFNKMWMYEESLRIPLIVSYPGHIVKNEINYNFISSLDFAPTLLDYAGAEIPSSMRGRSFRQILEGRKPHDWRTSFYYHYYDQYGVPEVTGIRTEEFKLINYSNNDTMDWELFDLTNDPHEMNNQINNPGYSDIINDLKDKMVTEKKRYEPF